MNNSTNIIINEYNDSNTFDNFFYTQIFTDKKIIISGALTDLAEKRTQDHFYISRNESDLRKVLKQK